MSDLKNTETWKPKTIELNGCEYVSFADCKEIIGRVSRHNVDTMRMDWIEKYVSRLTTKVAEMSIPATRAAIDVMMERDGCHGFFRHATAMDKENFIDQIVAAYATGLISNPEYSGCAWESFASECFDAAETLWAEREKRRNK